MTQYVKVGNAWQPITSLYVKVGNAWQTVTTGYVKTGGAWQTFHTSKQATLAGSNLLEVSAGDFSGGPYDSGAYYSLASNGVAYQYTKIGGSTGAGVPVGSDWRVGSDAASGYEVECVVTGGSLDAGSSPTGSGTWSGLGTTRTWYIESTGAGQISRTLSLTIRDATTQATLATATVTLSIDNSQ